MSAITIDAAAPSTTLFAEPILACPCPATLSVGKCQTTPARSGLSSSCLVQTRNQAPASERRWTIYLLVHRTSGRCYVGLTSRPLESRLRAHNYQARRIRSVRPGGLMEALQFALASGQTLTEAFSVEVIATATSRERARQLERHWIGYLGCRKPGGLNDMPGGGVGGRAGAIDIFVALHDGTVLSHGSIHDAILARNDALRGAGQPTLKPGIVYARLAFGWSPAEALGYSPHEDGRGIRDTMVIDGQIVGSLRAASGLLGVGMSALRSRLHRRTRLGSGAELGQDMRRTENDHTPRRSAALGLRLPGSSEPLAASIYAGRVGLPKSTILYRWHDTVRRGFDPARMSPVALFQRLTTGQDRRCFVMLQLPDGSRWTGGERELIRRVLSDASLDANRVPRLSESGIRRRLRLLPDHDRHDPAKVAIAFGFDPSIGGRS